METKHPKHELVRDSSQLSLVVCIWDCVLIRAFLPSCSYLQTLSSPLFFKFMVSFCLDCCCMHICIFTYIYIPKYNLSIEFIQYYFLYLQSWSFTIWALKAHDHWSHSRKCIYTVSNHLQILSSIKIVWKSKSRVFYETQGN